jgi:hypothetical protein
MVASFLERLDHFCYSTVAILIQIVSLICGFFIAWVSFISSIGFFIHMQFKEGFLFLFISLLSITIWRGSIRLLDKLKKYEKTISNWANGLPTEEEFELYKDVLMKIGKKYRGREALIKQKAFIVKRRTETTLNSLKNI